MWHPNISVEGQSRGLVGGKHVNNPRKVFFEASVVNGDLNHLNLKKEHYLGQSHSYKQRRMNVLQWANHWRNPLFIQPLTPKSSSHTLHTLTKHSLNHHFEQFTTQRWNTICRPKMQKNVFKVRENVVNNTYHFYYYRKYSDWYLCSTFFVIQECYLR